jgi:hypothetical protein
VRFGCEVEYRVAVPPGSTVSMATSSGGISAVGLRVTHFDATSGAGGIEASFASVPNHVKAVTSAGGITPTVPDATNEIIARSAAGGIRIGRG